MELVSINPADESVIFRHLAYDLDKVNSLIENASKGFEINSSRSITKRSAIIKNLAELFRTQVNELAELATLEMGKPIVQARAEVLKCANACEYFANKANQFLQSESIEPSEVGASEAKFIYEPLGLILGIMPWNFPYWQVIRFAVPALCAGNAVLLKHASNVSQISLKLEDLFRQAGFNSDEFISLLITSDQVKEVIKNPKIKGVSLTGSETAGKEVGKQAGNLIKPIVLELGGSDPFIVTASADLRISVEMGLKARLQNNSQSCIAAKRFIIEKSIKDRYVEELINALSQIKVGDPLLEDTELGPLATKQVLQDSTMQLEDALKKGASLVFQGPEVPSKGYYFAPVILDNLSEQMDIYYQEVFAPIFQIYQAHNLEHAVSIANATSFGLGAACFTQNDSEINYCIKNIDSGMVFINGITTSYPQLPFGGVKNSGVGRELSYLGIRSFCNVKTVWIK